MVGQYRVDCAHHASRLRSIAVNHCPSVVGKPLAYCTGCFAAGP